MKILLDTCVVIPVEPISPDELEEKSELIALLQRVCQQVGCQLYIHPVLFEELAHDNLNDRCGARQILLNRYLKLSDPPTISPDIKAIVGEAEPGSHDGNDNLLLAATIENLVDYLVTEDVKLIRRAERIGLRGRVLCVSEILKILEKQLARSPLPRPAIYERKAYQLNVKDEIFDELKNEYPEFEIWINKCRREHRTCWLIDRPDKTYSAVVIVNEERRNDYGFEGKVLKICTFRVSPKDFAKGFGELLLKTIFDYSFVNQFDQIFVEIFPDHGDLVAMLMKYGFVRSSLISKRNELVIVKRLTPSDRDREIYAPFEFNERFGPPRIKIEDARIFIVPIRPYFHSLLFPESAKQKSLFPGFHPSGNAIKKAYICDAKIKAIPSGSLLLFYLSRTQQSISCIGITEKSIRSNDAQKIIAFVGTRTIYPFQHIERIAKKEVLVIKFNHAINLESEWSLSRMVSAKVLVSHPQSIVEISKEALPWLKKNLEKWL